MNVIPQRVRDGFGKLIEPLAVVFIRLHIRPILISTVGTLVVIASATAFGLGWVRPGGLLLLVSGVFDLLDGRVARRADMTTTFGAFYDSTLDRVGESALFSGIALYFLRGGVPPERLTFAVVACLVALAASLIVSYTRARAEGLGLTAKVGIAQRAERVLLLGVPTVFFGAGNHGALLFWIVVVLAQNSNAPWFPAPKNTVGTPNSSTRSARCAIPTLAVRPSPSARARVYDTMSEAARATRHATTAKVSRSGGTPPRRKYSAIPLNSADSPTRSSVES